MTGFTDTEGNWTMKTILLMLLTATAALAGDWWSLIEWDTPTHYTDGRPITTQVCAIVSWGPATTNRAYASESDVGITNRTRITGLTPGITNSLAVRWYIQGRPDLVSDWSEQLDWVISAGVPSAGSAPRVIESGRIVSGPVGGQ